jgi:hypothetical protein
MSQRLMTFFVETHDYNSDTNRLDLTEYFSYESGVSSLVDRREIGSMIHHTILSLVVF